MIFLVVIVWMGWAILRHGPRHTAVHDHGERRSSWIWTVATAGLIFVVVDGDLLVRTLISVNRIYWNFDGAEKQPDAVRVEINAHQWAWDARYAGPDGKFNTADDIVTLNDIRVPADAPVLFQLASTDVIHSFYLPNFRIKRTPCPGMINRLWFQAKETGEYEIGCAQHCGANHYKMKGMLTVLSSRGLRRLGRRGLRQSARAASTAKTTRPTGAGTGRRGDELSASELPALSHSPRAEPFIRKYIFSTRPQGHRQAVPLGRADLPRRWAARWRC